MNNVTDWCRMLVRAVVATTCLLAVQSPQVRPAKADTAAADAMLGADAGQVRDDNALEMKLVWCPRGTVTMGDEEAPVRALLTRGFWIGKYEVTQRDWKAVMQTEPWQGGVLIRVGDDIAATFISWDDALAFCTKLTELERDAGRLPAGWHYTLPTEAQWEYACRANTTTAFSFGDDEGPLDQYAWYSRTRATLPAARNPIERPLSVGLKKPNPWGLHDMHGNVWEWCRDWYSDKRPGLRDPETTTGDTYRVIRGGSWWNSALDCRSGRRDRHAPQFGDFSVGFRAALSPIAAPANAPQPPAR